MRRCEWAQTTASTRVRASTWPDPSGSCPYSIQLLLSSASVSTSTPPPPQRPILLQGHERSITQIKYNREGDLLFSVAKDTVSPLLLSARTFAIQYHNTHTFKTDVKNDRHEGISEPENHWHIPVVKDEVKLPRRPYFSECHVISQTTDRDCWSPEGDSDRAFVDSVITSTLILYCIFVTANNCIIAKVLQLAYLQNISFKNKQHLTC